jgi:polar amino acid transport system substrate-binding protein
MLLCLLSGGLARAESYQVVTEEWAPYNYEENGQLTGMSTAIVRAIMKLTGDDFAIAMLPSMRATYALQNRPRTIMYSMFRTPEREPLYKWVGPIAQESIHPYQLASTAQPIISLEQLMHAPRITTCRLGADPARVIGFQESRQECGSEQSALSHAARRAYRGDRR